jgi:hypothetical protein
MDYNCLHNPQTRAKVTEGIRNYYANWSEDAKLLRGKTHAEWIAANGHPKGFLGHKHTESAKEKIRAAVTANNAMHNPVHREKFNKFVSSEECSKMRSAQCTGSGNPNARTVIYQGKIYKTMQEFYKETGISNYRANKLAKNNPELLQIIYTRDLNDYLERE